MTTDDLRTELTDDVVPLVPAESPIAWTRGLRWQVICGDDGHWRAGIYAPGEASRDEIRELERHDCPEMFLLIEGRMTLVYAGADGELCELALQPGRPVLMEAPHGGYCPDGAHQGVALVIERTCFATELSRVPGGGGQRRAR